MAEEKVSGETRIPAGEYRIGLRTAGGFNAHYSQRYKNFHKGMLQIQSVPGFEYILIHCGNTDEDTMGCLLIGNQADTTKGDLKILSSRQAYKNFYKMVVDSAEQNDLTILIKDNDR